MDLMREKAELKDRVEELEHRCIQLSGETDTIGEPTARTVLLAGLARTAAQMPPMT